MKKSILSRGVGLAAMTPPASQGHELELELDRVESPVVRG